MNEKENKVEATENGFTLKTFEEALPFLVKGVSAKLNTPVIGFPYIYTFRDKDGELRYCNCIFVPVEDNGTLEEQNGYDICFTDKEFHPIKGPMYKFVRLEEDGTAIFEDDDKV